MSGLGGYFGEDSGYRLQTPRGATARAECTVVQFRSNSSQRVPAQTKFAISAQPIAELNVPHALAVRTLMTQRVVRAFGR